MQMKLINLLRVCLLACVAPTTVKASITHGSSLHNRHADLAKRVEGDIQLFTRATGTRWTYYDVEETGQAGSCGKHHVNTDFTVAMNGAQMNPGWCFKTIRLTQGGKTTTATITDTCPGCPWGGLDLTEGLFAFFIGRWPQGGGVLSGDWEFTDAVKPPPPPITTPKKVVPATTIKPVVTSIVSNKKISSTTASSTKTSSSITSSSSIVGSSSSATSSINYLTGAAGGLAVPTGTVDTAKGPSNLQGLNQVFIGIGGLAMAGRSV